jgi:hypothetical protein
MVFRISVQQRANHFLVRNFGAYGVAPEKSTLRLLAAMVIFTSSSVQVMATD